MKFHRLAALFRVCIFLFACQVLAQRDESYSLRNGDGTPLVPYSSSYLPKYSGPLTTQVGTARTSLPLLSQDIAHNALNRTVFDRFSQIMSNSSEADLKLIQKMRDDYTPQPHLPSWHGSCNGWSGSSLEPEIAKFAQGIGDIVCDGTLLTRGEVLELLTAMGEPLGFSGSPDNRSGDKNGLHRPTITKIRNTLGHSNLSPAEFENFLIPRLQNNHGVVMDFDPGPEVWNHPIYAAHFHRTTIENASALIGPSDSTESLLAKLPASFLKGNTDEDVRLIESLIALDQNLVGNDTFIKENELASILSSRKRLLDKIQGRILERGIGVRENIKITKVESRVFYGMESSFAANVSTVNDVTYKYLLIEDGRGEVVGSSWIGPEEKGGRPEYLWSPRRFKDQPNGYFKWGEELQLTLLQNFMKLVNSDRCIKASQIGTFVQFVDTVEKSNRAVSDEDMKALRQLYAPLRDVADEQQMRKFITDKKIPGLEYSKLVSP